MSNNIKKLGREQTSRPKLFNPNSMYFLSVLSAFLLKLSKLFNSVAQFVCYRLLELIVVVIVMQVILRFGFNSPTKWSEEVALICLVWFGMLAAAICVQRNTHVSITFFNDLLPNRGQFVLELIVQLLIGSFATILIVNGYQLVSLTGSVRLPASQIPKGLLYLSAMFGGALMLINTIQNFFESLINPSTLR